MANVRTAEAARGGLAKGLALAFKGGSVTGMIVAGLALTAVAGCYTVLLASGTQPREAVIALVALGFGGSLISILLVQGITELLTQSQWRCTDAGYSSFKKGYSWIQKEC